jgi:hypothetical protein
LALAFIATMWGSYSPPLHVNMGFSGARNNGTGVLFGTTT